MSNLYFLRSNGERVLVEEGVTPETAICKIKNHVFNLNPNYKIYYVRCWETEEGTEYDVGSHTEFYLLSKEEKI